MMKKIVALMMLFVFGTVVQAKESDSGCLCGDIGLETSAKIGMFSSYVSRGVVTDSDPVLQNELSLGYKGCEFCYWTSMPASVDRDAIDSNEIDLTVSYGIDAGNFGFRAGHISYNFPFNGGVTTKEWFVSAEANSLPFSLCFTYYNDYDQINGSYSSLDIEKEIAADKDGIITLTPLFHYGMYGNYDTFASGGDIVVGLGAGVKLLDNLSFAPSVNYSMPSGDVADENIGNQKPAIFGGADFEFSF
ncbi:MAG: hypothetical protein ABII64_01345 [Elusimicrobiota bacterium]